MEKGVLPLDDNNSSTKENHTILLDIEIPVHPIKFEKSMLRW